MGHIGLVAVVNVAEEVRCDMWVDPYKYKTLVASPYQLVTTGECPMEESWDEPQLIQ